MGQGPIGGTGLPNPPELAVKNEQELMQMIATGHLLMSSAHHGIPEISPRDSKHSYPLPWYAMLCLLLNMEAELFGKSPSTDQLKLKERCHRETHLDKTGAAPHLL
eukprot:s219_g10.t1